MGFFDKSTLSLGDSPTHWGKFSGLGSGFRSRVFDLSFSPLLHSSLSMNMPPHIQKAVGFWHTLAPEFQRNIFYFQRNGEWCASIAGHIVSMQHETSETTKQDEGIYVGDEATYFSLDAASKRAQEKGAHIPTEESWISMTRSVGSWRALVELLSISFSGFYSINQASLYKNHNGGDNHLGVIKYDKNCKKHTVLHTGTVTTPFTLDIKTQTKTPVKDAKQYSSLYLFDHYIMHPLLPLPEEIMRTYDGDRKVFILGEILRDSHTPKVYWSCLRLAYR